MKLRNIAMAIITAMTAWAGDVTVTWTYDFNSGVGVVCTPTRTINCFETFETGIMVGGAPVVIATVPLPANPVGVVTGIGTTYTYNATFGRETVYVVMVAKDNVGGRITSDPLGPGANVEVVMKPSRPTGMAATTSK